jgi:FlaA1/EpsC-like NDP-sugar epimerase
MDTASVRFGNVLGSRGSFFHTLRHQLEHGLPVTLTHPDVTRYFMTVREAVGLVLEAAALASRGEVFILDMGEPVRILDLIESYARLAGLAAPIITITGLLPGEKLHETLFGGTEVAVATSHDRIWRTAGPPTSDGLASQGASPLSGDIALAT